MKAVRNVVYLLGLDEVPLKALNEASKIEVEHVYDGIGMINFQLDIKEDISVEQRIIYREEKYIISEVEEDKKNKITNVIADLTNNELNVKTHESIVIEGKSINQAANKILEGTGWVAITNVADSSEQFLRDDKKTSLYLLRKLVHNLDYQIKYDSINRIAYIVSDIGNKSETKTVLRYKKNVSSIKKTSYAPETTRITPYGSGGLSIDGVNDGIKYVEDFSWYMSLGFTEDEAREKFLKSVIWEDDRFIYAGNLMREAQKKLRTLSHPQITYEVEASILENDLKVGEYSYVVDEDLGIKVQVQVVRLLDYEDTTKNKYELNYLVPTLGGFETNSSDENGAVSQDMVLVKNENEITVDRTYTETLILAFSAFTSTNAQIGVTIVGEASEDMLLDGYFDIDGAHVGVKFMQNIKAGWNTLTFNFVIPDVENGSSTLKFMLKTDVGSLKMPSEESQMFVIAKNLLGEDPGPGVPEANVLDEVTFSHSWTNQTDSVDHLLELDDGE